jgi:hypothetical protein
LPNADVASAIAWLDAQWRLPTRLSTIPQALVAMGRAETDDLRWPIAASLARNWRQRLIQARADSWADHPERLADFKRQFRSWRFPIVVLTSTERLVGAVIVGSPGATSEAIASQLGVAIRDVDAAYDALDRVGLLTRATGPPRLADGHQRLLTGLGLAFHTVMLDDESAGFNITCAIDYVVLAKNAHAGKRLRLRDACAHSLTPIDVTFDADGVIDSHGPEPVLYRGGVCARNLLFRSPPDLDAWLNGTPPTGRAALLSEWLSGWGR